MSDQERTIRAQERRRCRRAFSLRNQTCQWCCYVDATARHHLDGDPRNNQESNVALLCTSCHGRAHSGERWAADRDPARYAQA